MTASEHLDFRGRTVDLAARVADESSSGDVVTLPELLDQADQSLVRGGCGITTDTFTTRLRGLARGRLRRGALP